MTTPEETAWLQRIARKIEATFSQAPAAAPKPPAAGDIGAERAALAREKDAIEGAKRRLPQTATAPRTQTSAPADTSVETVPGICPHCRGAAPIPAAGHDGNLKLCPACKKASGVSRWRQTAR